MTSTTRSPASRPDHALLDIIIVIVASGLAYGAELAAAGYLPWGEEGRGVIAVLVGAAAALALTFGRGGTLADLGCKRPKRWSTVPIWALAIMVVYVVAQGTVPFLVVPFFDLPQPDMSRYDAIRGNLSAAITMALILPLTASIPEEIVYRGFLIDRLSRLFGTGHRGAVLAVLVQSLIFGSVHFQWGVGGIVFASIMGAVWGTAFLLCGRNLWIVIIAHSTAHIAMVAELYFSPVPA